MADNLSPADRKKNMSHIRSKDTKIEKTLRRELWKRGYRYRKNYEKLPGKPDIVLTKYKIAVFCDGEFFHGKDWDIRRSKIMESNNAFYWVQKIEKNMERDRKNDRQLQYLGWTVIRFWGKDILKNAEGCIRVIEEAIFDNKMKHFDMEDL